MDRRKWLAVVSALVSALLAGCIVEEEASAPTPPPPTAQPSAAALPEAPPKTAWIATASELEKPEHPAAKACDGDMNTRWSTGPSDPQWLAIDLGAPTVIAGCTIHWERAFGSHYLIEVSPDGATWQPVYEMKQGDGRTDEIYFPAVTARHLRVYGKARPNGWWGYSIFELEVKGPAQAIAAHVEGQDEMQTLDLFDGTRGGLWRSPTPPPCRIDIDLRSAREVGGLWIDWGENYGTAADLSISDDGLTWEKVGGIADSDGDYDVIRHAMKRARHIRLDISRAASHAPVEIRELSLCSPGEDVEPLAEYALAARRARRGLYSIQLLREQVYWTLVGIPGDTEESLFDEFGGFEPKAKSGSLVPFLEVEGKLIGALDAEKLTHGLAGQYMPLPTVTWHSRPLSLHVQALARGSTNDSASYVLYTISNVSESPHKGRLDLLVRPLQINPVWQFGGVAPITSLEFRDTEAGKGVYISNRLAYVSLTAPSRVGARPFLKGDAIEDLARGRFPASANVSEAGNMVSGALSYDFDLPPGGEANVLVAAPLHETDADIAAFARELSGRPSGARELFEQARSAAEQMWSERLNRATVSLPQQLVTDSIRSQVGYMLINQDGPAIQPGSRNYKRAWIRDGSVSSTVLLRMGLNDEVRAYLDWYAERVQPDGWVPPILNNDGSINKGFGWDNEYDSQGEYVFAIMQYYRFTRDRAFLEKHFESMVRALKYLQMLREKTLAPDYMAGEPARERFVGILPASISHEGYHPGRHSYWDDYFALKGWKDGREAAQILGRQDIATWADEQYRLLRDSTRESISRSAAFKQIDFAPGCAELGDGDACSPAIAFNPCDEADLADPTLMRNLFERYNEELQRRIAGKTDGGFGPYEMRIMPVFVAYGQRDRAKQLLDNTLGGQRPSGWNSWAEVVYGDPRKGAYFGDLPHTWVGAGFVNSVIAMLLKEDGDRLVLLPGIPPDWLEGEGIRLSKLGTHFGPLDLQARMADGKLAVELGGALDAPGGIELRWPVAGRPAQVTVDGQPWSDFSEVLVRIPPGARQVLASWQRNTAEVRP